MSKKFSLFLLTITVLLAFYFFPVLSNFDESELELITTPSGIEMVRIPGGFFLMGSARGDPDERPVHRVRVDSFYMDRYEVTQASFRRLEISDPSHFKGPNQPVEQINWELAARYCNIRSEKEGLQKCYDEQTWKCNLKADGYRLPTEAEWEYACRAGTERQYFFRGAVAKLKDYAWYSENSFGRTHPVGRRTANNWGLYDVYGNVAEWCNDYYSDQYYEDSPKRNPRGPADGRERVVRGGSWNDSPRQCSSSFRHGDISINDTCLASDEIGFRCVRRIAERSNSEMTSDIGLNGTDNVKTGFVYDNIYQEHKTGKGHPESPERLTAIIAGLKNKGVYSKLAKIQPKKDPLVWIRKVHSEDYITRAKESCEKQAGYLDSPDVPISARSYEAAVAAVGGVLSGVDAVMANRVENVFCAVRPPGHHALRSEAMGFCIFNNVAIAARYIRTKYDLERILIVDWDVHHGNGTQSEFYSDPNVFYFSVHQSPFYPGTGSQSQAGAGEGVDFIMNVPLSAGSGDEEYLKVFREKLLPAATEFAPDFVLISAGFDAAEGDIIGGMEVTPGGFAELTTIVKRIAEQSCQGRLLSVLEGGYKLDVLAESVQAHINVLMGEEQ